MLWSGSNYQGLEQFLIQNRPQVICLRTLHDTKRHQVLTFFFSIIFFLLIFFFVVKYITSELFSVPYTVPCSSYSELSSCITETDITKQ